MSGGGGHTVLNYTLNSGSSSSSLSELKNRRLFRDGLLSLREEAFLLRLDPTLTTLLLDEALDRERPLGGLVGALGGSLPVAPPGSTCTQNYTTQPLVGALGGSLPVAPPRFNLYTEFHNIYSQSSLADHVTLVGCREVEGGAGVVEWARTSPSLSSPSSNGSRRFINCLNYRGTSLNTQSTVLSSPTSKYCLK